MRHRVSIDVQSPVSSSLEPAVGPPKQPDEESFSACLIPPNQRSDDWLNRVSSKLARAAQAYQEVFWVPEQKIVEKLKDAEDLAVLTDQMGVVVAFISVRRPFKMPRTGLMARYIEGVISHPNRGAKGKFGLLMNALGEQADLEILHTQNPYMAVSLRRRSAELFPAPDYSFSLTEELCADLGDLLGNINRNEKKFDPVTGIVQDMYEHRLYGTWPLSGSTKALSFNELGETSAVMVVGFKEAGVARKWLKTTAPEIG